METRKAVAHSKSIKKVQKKVKGINKLIDRRNQAYAELAIKKWRETWDWNLHPYNNKRLNKMSQEEKEKEFVETRTEAILPTDWEENYEFALNQLAADPQRQELALIRYDSSLCY